MTLFFQFGLFILSGQRQSIRIYPNFFDQLQVDL